MALSCGCEIRGGMPVTKAMAQAHYKHTIEAIMVWGVMQREGEEPLSEARIKLQQAIANLYEAIEELFPEAKME